MSKPKESIKINEIPFNQVPKKKKSRQKNGKEIDMVKLKKKILDEMANAIASKIEVDPQSQYSAKYKEYISEDFSSTCIVFINRLISESKTLSDGLKNEHNIHKYLLRIVKELMMDEYEITILSLYLDEYGWSTNDFSIEDHLLFVSLFVKKSMKNIELFFKYYEQIDKGIVESYKKWSAVQNEPKTYCNNEIDLRFRKLKKSFNTYCKTNYIDYNSVVDKILRMSLPYNENNKQKEENLDHTIDDSIANTSHNNLINNKTIKQQKTIQNNDYSYNPADLVIINNRYNKDCNKGNKNPSFNMNSNQRGITPMQKSNPKILIHNQVITQDLNSIDNLKIPSTNLNPFPQGINCYSNSMKFDDIIVNSDSILLLTLYLDNNQLNYLQQNMVNSSNPLQQPFNSHLESIQNRNENESLQNLLNKSNNNFCRSAFSNFELFNSDLYPFRVSSLKSFNCDLLDNERLKGSEAQSNTSIGQNKYSDSSKELQINFIQSTSNNYSDTYNSKKDSNFSQLGIDCKSALINALINNTTKAQNNTPRNSDFTVISSFNQSNGNNSNISDKKNLFDKFQSLKHEQAKDK